MENRKAALTAVFSIGTLATLVIAGLYGVSRQNYLLFHTIVEMVCVSVACTTFSIGWNSRRFTADNGLLLLATSYLVVGCLDLLHALAYKGMPFFGNSSNTATQLWIASRGVEAISLVLAAVVSKKGSAPKANIVLGTYLAIGITTVAAIFQFHIFPIAYVELMGLTTFKVVSEYVIILLFATAGLFFWNERGKFGAKIIDPLLLAISFTILAELCFTVYIDVYSSTNAIGHLLRLGSQLLIYTAFVHSSLHTPYESIFRSLARERALLNSVLAQLPSGVVLVEAPSGRLIMKNDKASVFLDNAHMAPSTTDQPAAGLSPTKWLAEQANAPLYAAIHESKVVHNQELDFAHTDGSTATLLVSAAPVKDAAGNTIAGVAVLDDITEQKHMELALRKAESNQHEAQNRFLQVAAHELRNPMTALKGVCTLLIRRAAVGKPIGDLPGLIEREVDRLALMLNEMLEAFRIQRGQLSLHQKPICITEIVDASMLMFMAGDASNRFTIEKPSVPVWVLGDANRLEDALRNLIGNAVKYSPAQSPIRLQVSTDSDSVMVSIEDKGVGIPADQLERVFYGFFRASNVATSGPSGLGLGLYICGDIIRRHGGRIWAESVEGQGSRFIIALPLYHPNLEPQIS